MTCMLIFPEHVHVPVQVHACLAEKILLRLRETFFPLSVECRKCERPRESGDGLLPSDCIASTGKKS